MVGTASGPSTLRRPTSNDNRKKRPLWDVKDPSIVRVDDAKSTGRIFHLPGQHNQKLHGGGGDLGIGPLDNIDLEKGHAITTGKNKAELRAALVDAGLDGNHLDTLSSKEQYEVLKSLKKTTPEDLATARAERGGGSSTPDNPITHEDMLTSYEGWSANLSDDERNSIEAYSNITYRAINGALRGTATPEQMAKYQRRAKPHVEHLDSALAKGALPRDAIVYRGMTVHDTVSVGDVFTDKGYGSTSLSKAVVEETFSSPTSKPNRKTAITTVKVKKGSPGGYVDHVIQDEEHSEREFLLPRNVTYRVVGRTTVGDILHLDLEIEAFGDPEPLTFTESRVVTKLPEDKYGWNDEDVIWRVKELL